MNEQAKLETVPLLVALTEWTEPTLVAKVKAQEQRLTLADLTYFSSFVHRPRLSQDSQLAKPRPGDSMTGLPDFGLLIATHDDLVRDFRDRLVRGEIHLRGVQIKLEMTTKPRNIPGVWAAECAFDFKANCVNVAKMRFVPVTASHLYVEDAFDEVSSVVRSTSGQPKQVVGLSAPITEESVRHLTDEEVLVLLEDRARRVVEGPDAALFPPRLNLLYPNLAPQDAASACLRRNARDSCCGSKSPGGLDRN